MNKRMRKKHHVGEFEQLGFALTFTLGDGVSDEGVDRFIEEFVARFLEPRDLACGGSTGRSWEVFVSKPNGRSVTEDDRVAASAWLGAWPGVEGIQMGPLEDAWHPDRRVGL